MPTHGKGSRQTREQTPVFLLDHDVFGTIYATKNVAHKLCTHFVCGSATILGGPQAHMPKKDALHEKLQALWTRF
jgi:hypothetical protein